MTINTTFLRQCLSEYDEARLAFGKLRWDDKAWAAARDARDKSMNTLCGALVAAAPELISAMETCAASRWPREDVVADADRYRDGYATGFAAAFDAVKAEFSGPVGWLCAHGGAVEQDEILKRVDALLQRHKGFSGHVSR